MINAGKEQGVFPKSELSFLEGNKKTPSGVVKVADATTATLIVTTILDKDEEDPSIHLVKGLCRNDLYRGTNDSPFLVERFKPFVRCSEVPLGRRNLY